MAGPLFKSRLRPWVGLTHGLVWAGSDRVGLGRDFSVFGALGWVESGPLQQKVVEF